MANDRDTLLAMGFDPARVDWALRATSNRGLQPAMDHLLENEGKDVPDTSSGDVQEPKDSTGDGDGDGDDEMDGGGDAADLEAKSIKCSECGKVFRNTALANYHAEKSGHDQFEESTEEIKPLTEEEKAQKLAELRAKMASKRSLKADEEVKERQANEVIRRKAGKDMNKIKEEMRVREAVKEAEQRRKDKIDDAKARAAVKAQVEADKRARAEKAAREKALREGKPIPTDDTSGGAPSTPPVAPSESTPSGVVGKDFKETRLQIRVASGGTPYTTTLPSDSTLREVAEFMAAQSLTFDVESISFTQHFPRKAFSKADFSKTLRELGLTPSAVLIASSGN